MKTTLVTIALIVVGAMSVNAQRSTQRTGTPTTQKHEVKDDHSDGKKSYVAPRNRGTVRSTSTPLRKVSPKPVHTISAGESKKSR